MNSPSFTAARSAAGQSRGTGIKRREFLSWASGSSLALLGLRLGATAGPFDAGDFDRLVPADKKLRTDWVRSLFERGSRTAYRGAELQWIGMPVGGLCAGQLYLGGDGKLWHWDIFNSGFNSATTGPHYAQPLSPNSALAHGFAAHIQGSGGTDTRQLDRGGFGDVAFNGEYPIGTVEYKDSRSPVAISMEAFSPFIPLATRDSMLPATVFRFTVRNVSQENIEATLSGWLENAVCLNHRDQNGIRRNQIIRSKGMTFLNCSAVKAAPSSEPAGPLEGLPDFGTMGLALLGEATPHRYAHSDIGGLIAIGNVSEDASAPLHEKLIGAIGKTLRLAAGESAEATFVLTWHFPNLQLDRLGKVGRSYAARFDSAQAVAQYVTDHFERLSAETRLWHNTWYDSTLPYWFLDRTFLNISILATSTAYHFADGRFYSWEGVGCCAGTCTHVWHYAHALARLFPELERNTREHVDLGIAFNPDNGVIGFRAEFDRNLAVDGQAGTLLRIYREHQMSAEDSFLKRNWPRIKKAFDPLLRLDADEDGVLEGAQMNTLDTAWYGKIAWLSSLYAAALRAGEQMAKEMGDVEFAQRCRGIADSGMQKMVEQLFNGEYFSNQADPKHPEAINSGTGCEIDQVFGQSWAFQVNLGRVLPAEQTRAALRALWKYNFTPDVGLYRKVHKPGRWYAMPGEAGLLMCTFPRADWNYGKAAGKGPDWAAGYFNECMNGFEYEVAGHMIQEGMSMEGLAVARAIHDRYHPSRRNPWNEIECGDHYSRSMASYGVFLAACGFEYHGPKGHFGFSPRISPENFRAAFTSAEGWGTFAQKIGGSEMSAVIRVKWGKVRVASLAFGLPDKLRPTYVRVKANGREVPAAFDVTGSRLAVTLSANVQLAANGEIQIAIG